MRIALGIEYSGTKFHGWQSQDNLPTIQKTLEQALSKVANETITVACAGRTDAGVHASHQVIHFDTTAARMPQAWVLGTNSYLPKSINVQWVKEVDESFHARFSALSRQYQYFIYNNAIRSCISSPYTSLITYPLNWQKMHLAAQCLIGEHDFTSFRSAECQSRTPFRHIFNLSVFERGKLIKIEITANSFLHHMVRNIVGVLIEIGANRKESDWCANLLQIRNRQAGGRTASPQGLFLTGVRYADSYNLPCFSNNPFFWDNTSN